MSTRRPSGDARTDHLVTGEGATTLKVVELDQLWGWTSPCRSSALQCNLFRSDLSMGRGGNGMVGLKYTQRFDSRSSNSAREMVRPSAVLPPLASVVGSNP